MRIAIVTLNDKGPEIALDAAAERTEPSSCALPAYSIQLYSDERMTKPPELRLRPIEGRLGSSLSRWKDLIAQTQRSVARPDFSPKEHGPGHAEQLAQVLAEIEVAEADLRSL